MLLEDTSNIANLPESDTATERKSDKQAVRPQAAPPTHQESRSMVKHQDSRPARAERPEKTMQGAQNSATASSTAPAVA